MGLNAITRHATRALVYRLVPSALSIAAVTAPANPGAALAKNDAR